MSGGMSPQTYVQMAKHSAQLTHMGANLLKNMYQGRKFQKRADASKPPLVDQKEAGFLNEINMKRKNIDTGVGYAAQEREADQFTANAQANVMRAGGGDIGATMNGLLLAARMGGNMYNEGAVTQASQQQNMLTSMAGGLVSKIADRKMQLQLADRAQYLAQAMNHKQQANVQGTQLMNHILDTDAAGLGMMGGGTGTNQSVNGVAAKGAGGGGNSGGGGGGMMGGMMGGKSGGGGGMGLFSGNMSQFGSMGDLGGGGGFSSMPATV